MNLFTLMATIGLDTIEFEKGIRSTTAMGEKLMGGIQKTTDFVKKATAVATGAAVAGFTKIVSDAFEAVSEYEQNIGGSMAVWGEYADEIQTKAQSAAKLMGSSASDFLANQNQLGALLQGMGFDTATAFEMATEGAQRAADVASIMGIDVSTALNALTGAAKGNFTMMDNLGVAINDTALANYALEKGIKTSVRAMSTPEKVLLAWQLFMEESAYATGNYAKENDTLAGSISTLKASWRNFLDGSGTAVDLVDSIVNAAEVGYLSLKDIVPRLGNTLAEAGKLLAPEIEKAFGQIWDGELPAIVTKGANGVIGWINDTFGTNIPKIENINFPSWAEIKDFASTWWTDIGGSLKKIANWTLGALNLPDVDTIAGKIENWWTGQGSNAYERIKSVLVWTLGEFGVPVTEDVVSTFSLWWTEYAHPGITSVAQWGFGELVLPAWADLMMDISNWWTTSISPKITALAEWDIGEMKLPSWEEMEPKVKTWWNSVKGFFEDVVQVQVKVGYKYSQSELSGAEKWEIDTVGGATRPVKVDGSNAKGLDYVPFNDYVSRLHRGEAILTAREAEKWRAEQSGSYERESKGIRDVNVYVASVPQSPSEIAFETANALRMLRFNV